MLASQYSDAEQRAQYLQIDHLTTVNWSPDWSPSDEYWPHFAMTCGFVHRSVPAFGLKPTRVWLGVPRWADFLVATKFLPLVQALVKQSAGSPLPGLVLQPQIFELVTEPDRFALGGSVRPAPQVAVPQHTSEAVTASDRPDRPLRK
ncbi:hypothetical protein [Streptomyces flaveus]|uniref:Uncharacterized protein n=1 Tax=Streptomyces flaveus TaxID=66370 RepID=A0A917QRG7_9ACTN|nr:hypothetical protein [Streptomyces flaveus]GGK63594.1 hypothetical protein GCM10010094_25520 [Streptomyces flaveus]